MKQCRVVKAAYDGIPSLLPLVRRLTLQPWSNEGQGRNRRTVLLPHCTIVSQSWVVTARRMLQPNYELGQ